MNEDLKIFLAALAAAPFLYAVLWIVMALPDILGGQ